MVVGRRDYKAEYVRRIARGQTKGLSRSQARGHPAGGESLTGLSQPAWVYNQKLEAGFKAIRDGKSLTAAAKQVRVSPERLRRYLHGHGFAERRGKKWVALPDTRHRRALMYSNRQALTVTVDLGEAAQVGAYMSSVNRFLRTNDRAHLRWFEGLGVDDIRGVSHPFETDPNTLYRLAHPGDETFEQIYRIVMP